MSDEATTPAQYDVAISFSWEDRSVAKELYELLRDRLDVFFSDERPEEFAGKDGEEAFSTIFKERCRIAVVLYRSSWGKTTFTRPEEAGIRRRGFTEGYTFSLWVPMERGVELPGYIPPQLMWLDFERYGVKALAATVEARVRESGVQVRPPSAEDKLMQLRRTRERERERLGFIRSPAAMAFFDSEVERLKDLAEEQAKRLEAVDPELHFKVDPHRTGRGVQILANGFDAEITHYRVFSAEESHLSWHISKRGGDTVWNTSRVGLASAMYRVDLDLSGNPVWKTKGDEYSDTETLVEHVVGRLAVLTSEGLKERLR